ncbi:MAG: lysine--tRNA ligase [Aestuariivita sp.]|nr:lysine--tRNA ligase [Aestuariivita sp.]MCY4201359.1 lysine--tRNA ligase [Aestuariivita sp.]
MSELRNAALQSKAWPFEEARRLLHRVRNQSATTETVVFETGYGPSGLPHIGTFGEVARTTMVRRAFELISDRPTKLICFSDDMDGLRRVPDNIPNASEIHDDLNLPLTRVRDPFGMFESFGAHNNARLRNFLDRFGFDYEFASSTKYYQSGRFDEMLMVTLEKFDEIMAVMLPTLGKERQATYSPFLPISPLTGHVLQVPTLERSVSNGTIVYQEPSGERIEIPVTGGHAKLQWKPDWAMRWAALDVDYEMAGKDLDDSVKQAAKICQILGKRPPVNLSYELFNDENGQKISKSKGNGLSLEDWLAYAAPETLQLFMYQKPKTAKRLYFDSIPLAVDQYHQQLRAFPEQNLQSQLNNPVFHIHNGDVPQSNMTISFAMLLNLASVVGSEDRETLWHFIRRYSPNADPKAAPQMDEAVDFAINYYRDRVKPNKRYRLPSKEERVAIQELQSTLISYQGPVDEESLQSLVYAVGRDRFDPLRDWFTALYEVLLGSSQGPRFGGFIALFGIAETTTLIEQALAGMLVNEAKRSPSDSSPTA